ncbi:MULTISPECIES: hypothetical protein [Mesorhizobium]|uniref:hypothetical protein n=1 Tax=Mesorhizobium sp. TaxID=1871066 RepID=UPI000A9CE40B|nr:MULTISPECIES: hypothetical protein [Mesorhizobium]RWM69195.1 MAG: hypothetical protein EOR82_23455 [Mesorhizobium sp.]TIO21138.1 MAG: hypothetical protein E5X83_30845 [Mesorhizobium sp.]TJV54775.1 MAG: hypothetical protein E5X82_30020 [Mesorhizobium sp.]
MRIVPHRFLRPAVIAWLLFTVQTFAQTGQQDDLPGQGASPTTENPRDPQDVGVDVSLGRQEVKQKIAAQLGISENEVPLAVHVPIELAERVCEKAAFDARSNTNRSCTATKYIPEIAEAARNHPQTSAVPEQ